MRALVAGWFSIAGGGATAGDLLVRDVMCDWLREAGIEHDVAQERSLGPGVDWFRVSPARYTDVIVACGPTGPGPAVAEIPVRFPGCRRLAVGGGPARPGVALAAARHRTPVVARVEGDEPAEHAEPGAQRARAAFDRLLAGRPAAALHVDTRLDPDVPGRRDAAEVGALIGAADVVLTTQVHGLVLALRHGVPAVAVDPVAGGANVLAQARALAWPAVLTLDALDDAALEREFTWCLGPDAVPAARAAVDRALVRGVADVRAELHRHFAGRRQDGAA